MYRLAFSDKKYFLHVKAVGTLNKETDAAIDAEIKSECEKRKIDSVLIDIRYMNSRLSGIENHIAAQSFSERIGNLSSIAIVDLEKYISNSEMFEITARNRDANVRFFNKVTDAIEWILGNSSTLNSVKS